MTTQLDTLIAVHEITTLKHRYGRTLDNRLWEDFGATLTPDATARYGTVTHGEPLHFDGRNAIVDFMKRSLAGDIVTTHTFGNPEISVDVDTATATWSMTDTVVVPDLDSIITGTSYYTDRYRRIDGRWYIDHTEYYRLYEAMASMTAGDYRLLANKWSVTPCDMFFRNLFRHITGPRAERLHSYSSEDLHVVADSSHRRSIRFHLRGGRRW